jgi:hypothetical protein
MSAEVVPSEWLRFQLAGIDICKKRQIGGINQTEEEICTDRGITVDRYYEILLREDQRASSFEQTLIREFLTPRGFETPDRRSLSIFKLNFQGALKEALEAGKPWIIHPSGGDLDDLIIVSARELIKWLINNPKRNYLISPNLRARFESKGPLSVDAPSAGAPHQSPAPVEASMSVPLVSQPELNRFVNEHSDREKTEDEVKVLAEKHFAPRKFPRSRWREARGQCPKKRARGETRRSAPHNPPA